MKKLSLLCLISVSLSGCAMSGLNAPQAVQNHISGTVQAEQYHASIGRGGTAHFVVNIPQAMMGAEYRYVHITDHLTANQTSVTFGPSWHDANVYRLTISKINPNTSALALKKKAVKQLEEEMTAAYHNRPYVLYGMYVKHNAKKAWYGIFQQDTVATHEVLTQLVYLFKQKNYWVQIWITSTDASLDNPVNSANRIAVVNRTWKPANMFLQSLKIDS